MYVLKDKVPEKKLESNKKLTLESLVAAMDVVDDNSNVVEEFDTDVFDDIVFEDEAADTTEADIPIVQVKPCFIGCQVYRTEAKREECTERKITKFVQLYFDNRNVTRVSGKAKLELVISPKGHLTSVKVINESNYLLGDELVRLVRLMPIWNLGRVGGHEATVK